MKSWIKGGLIGGGVDLILYGIILLDTSINILIGMLLMSMNSLILPSSCSVENCYPEIYTILLPLSLLEFFIIGALIGWLVGKYQNKNN